MILDGKKVSNEIIDELKEKINALNKKINFAIIWVGNDASSNIYVKNKIKKCESVGINAILYHLDENTSEKNLIGLIDELNNNNDICGILLQSPVPSQININNCFNKILPQKDIDGFSNQSIGNLVLNKSGFVSCTPLGIIKLLEYYNIDVSGKHVVIINRSNIVGKPLFHLLVNKDATVTMCHSKTSDLYKYTKDADILITAVGKPNFITQDMVKEGAVVIDVGICRINNKVCGDVNFDMVARKASYITPVPGGVGPMTIAMVINNIYESVRDK